MVDLKFKGSTLPLPATVVQSKWQTNLKRIFKDWRNIDFKEKRDVRCIQVFVCVCGGGGGGGVQSRFNLTPFLFLHTKSLSEWCQIVSDRRIWLIKFHSDWQKINFSASYLIVRTDQILKISPNDWHVQKDFNISEIKASYISHQHDSAFDFSALWMFVRWHVAVIPCWTQLIA